MGGQFSFPWVGIGSGVALGKVLPMSLESHREITESSAPVNVASALATGRGAWRKGGEGERTNSPWVDGDDL